MDYYKQNDPRWGHLKINGTSSTMAQKGCFITCLAMLKQITPDQCLKRLEDGGAFNKDLIISTKACEVLGLTFNGLEDIFGRTQDRPKYNCIAECDSSSVAGVQQHFVIALANGWFVDSLTGEKTKNLPYKILNYRQIRNLAYETILELKDAWVCADNLIREDMDKTDRARCTRIKLVCGETANYLRTL